MKNRSRSLPRTLAAAGSFAVISAAVMPTNAGDPPPPPPSVVNVLPEWSAARAWNEALMEAIRKAFPNPPIHARNLFHSGAMMYSVWCAYQDEATPYLGNEHRTAADIEDARAEAISFAMYRFLKSRFAGSPNIAVTGPMLDSVFDQMDALWDFEHDKTFTDTTGDSPAALGNLMFQKFHAYGLGDGSNQPNGYADYTGYVPVNGAVPFGVDGVGVLCENVPPELEGLPCFSDPDRWAPLAFEYLVLQNGIVVGEATQAIVAPWGGYVKPFALPKDIFQPEFGLYHDPGDPAYIDDGDGGYQDAFVEVIERSRDLDPTSGPGAELIDIGPFSHHNNALGADDGPGYGTNPFTGQPYEPVMVPRGDYARCLAEFWADGPASETPPGHWHVVANDMTDHMVELEMPLLIGGSGEEVDRLEWDVKLYFGLGGASHDAAVNCWGIKRHYDYTRPLLAIRYMAVRGQSSDPELPNYHPHGLPLIPGLIELITEEEVQPGGKFEHLVELVDNGFEPPFIDNHVNDVAILAWSGHPENQATEIGGIGWILGYRWLTYQLTTFVTPAFPGYVSGHSTFSRAAAEFLTGYTGSDYYPGGIGTYTFTAHEFLKFEDGPSVDVQLTWAKYKDAADEAGISRRYGGIHPYVDDYPGRQTGFIIGQDAWSHAQLYFSGEVTGCGADFSNDGFISSADLNVLLASFGSNDGGDIDGDGDTDSIDLNLLLGSFGDLCT